MNEHLEQLIHLEIAAELFELVKVERVMRRGAFDLERYDLLVILAHLSKGILQDDALNAFSGFALKQVVRIV